MAHIGANRMRGALLATLVGAFLLSLVGLGQRAQAAPQPQTGVEVPILMYHSVLERQNDSEYCISVEKFRADMTYLKDHGYQTVFVSDLVAYVEQGTPLPEKPVVVTLDDGYLNGKTAVLPILEELDQQAVISVVGSYTEQSMAEGDPDPRYAYLTWADIATLSQSKRVEIGSHTYAMHDLTPRKGASRRQGEDEGAYQAALRTDLTKLQTLLAEESGVVPTVFAWPYGACSSAGVAVLRELGFTAALTCEERVNCLTVGETETLFHLGRFHRPSSLTTEDYMQHVGIC
jgi:peptidoglycan/xylan/chitin deacetylase (PgdA/CDA1 family)